MKNGRLHEQSVSAADLALRAGSGATRTNSRTYREERIVHLEVAADWQPELGSRPKHVCIRLRSECCSTKICARRLQWSGSVSIRSKNGKNGRVQFACGKRCKVKGWVQKWWDDKLPCPRT